MCSRPITASYGPITSMPGLDFSTGGQVNLPVLRSSRWLCIPHKGKRHRLWKMPLYYPCQWKVTVYGHLNSQYKNKRHVKKEQYAQESYEGSFSKTFMVPKKVKLLAFRQYRQPTGPHLHFEIRDEKSEAPLKSFSSFCYPDRTRPMIQTVACTVCRIPRLQNLSNKSGCYKMTTMCCFPTIRFINIDNPYIGIVLQATTGLPRLVAPTIFILLGFILMVGSFIHTNSAAFF